MFFSRCSFVLYALSVLAITANAGESKLREGDKEFLIALIDANRAVVETLSGGTFNFESVHRTVDRIEIAKGTATWFGDSKRIEYAIESTRDSEMVELKRSQLNTFDDAMLRKGIAIDSPTFRAVHDLTSRHAYRGINSTKQIRDVLQVFPEVWLDYDSEINLEEVWSADNTFDYGVRHALLTRTETEARLRIGRPGSSGFIETEFDLQKGGLVRRVIHNRDDGRFSRIEFDWEQSNGALYLRELRRFRRGMTASFDQPVFQLVITNLVPRDFIDPELFRESSLQIDSSTTITTYVTGREPSVRKGRPSADKVDTMRALGESLKNVGFTRQQP